MEQLFRAFLSLYNVRHTTFEELDDGGLCLSLLSVPRVMKNDIKIHNKRVSVIKFRVRFVTLAKRLLSIASQILIHDSQQNIIKNVGHFCVWYLPGVPPLSQISPDCHFPFSGNQNI